MSNEIHADYPSSQALYACVRNAAGNVWYPTGQVFEAWGTGSRDADDYDIAMTDKSGGAYVGSFDANITTAGRYYIQVFLQAGSSPADGDNVIANGEIIWNGTQEQQAGDFVPFLR